MYVYCYEYLFSFTRAYVRKTECIAGAVSRIFRITFHPKKKITAAARRFVPLCQNTCQIDRKIRRLTVIRVIASQCLGSRARLFTARFPFAVYADVT